MPAASQKVVEPGHNHLKGYETGVTFAVAPVLSFGFCGAERNARHNSGQRKEPHSPKSGQHHGCIS
jgi:hypothetical protein